MRFQPRRSTSLIHLVGRCCLFAILLSFVQSSSTAHATSETASADRGAVRVVCRHNISRAHRNELAEKLRKITGLPELEIESSGVLSPGNREAVGGSRKARELLLRVVWGANAVVLEDASRRSDVAFMRVVPGTWKVAKGDRPPAFVVQIDFADFNHVMGDGPALAAFDVGWGLLHELDHIANDSKDAAALGEAGDCEARINEMRLECDLPQRTDYFYTLSPLTLNTTFTTRLVRLAFEQPQSGEAKKKRYWVTWDANLVGGIDQQKQVAVLR